MNEYVSSDTIKRTPRLTQLVKGSSKVVHRLLAPSSQPQVLLKEPHSLRTSKPVTNQNQQLYKPVTNRFLYIHLPVRRVGFCP